MPDKMLFKGRVVFPGLAEGEALVARNPVAISGSNLECETGRFRWEGHELNGRSLQGKVLIMPTGLGYSGGDWALYGMKSIYGTGPAAIVCLKADVFTASGAILGEIPLVDGVEDKILVEAETGDHVRVHGNRGLVEVIKKGISTQPMTGLGLDDQGLNVPSMMTLSDEERRMVEGHEGEGVSKCMQYLIKLGQAFGAHRLLPISSAHPAAVSYLLAGVGGQRFVEWLAKEGVRVRVPATLNPVCVDHVRWETVMKLPVHFFENQKRMDVAFRKLGFIPTYSCTPYLGFCAPRFGDHVAWGEHNAVCYANSVLGARTNFEAHITAIPAAITGKIPEYGLHLKENRKAQVIVRAEVDMESPLDWMCLGQHIGRSLFDRIPVITGLPGRISNRHLRDLVTSVGPPFGKIPLVHILGVTPEARTLEAAFQGRVPEHPETLVVGRRQLEEARSLVCNATSDKVDLVALGCPHYSFEDLEEVAGLLEGRKVDPQVQLWVWTDNATRTVAADAGLVEIIERAGGHVLTDTCPVAGAMEECGFSFKTMATDKAKAAGFMVKGGKIKTYLGDPRECIEAAVMGRWPGRKEGRG